MKFFFKFFFSFDKIKNGNCTKIKTTLLEKGDHLFLQNDKISIPNPGNNVIKNLQRIGIEKKNSFNSDLNNQLEKEEREKLRISIKQTLLKEDSLNKLRAEVRNTMIQQLREEERIKFKEYMMNSNKTTPSWSHPQLKKSGNHESPQKVTPKPIFPGKEFFFLKVLFIFFK